MKLSIRLLLAIPLAAWLCVACGDIPTDRAPVDTKTGQDKPADTTPTDTTPTDSTPTDSTPTDTTTPLPADSSPTLGALVRVPAGSYQRDAKPANVSQVSSFQMSRYEVTYDQYEGVMDLVGALMRSYSDGSGSSPATYVSWYDAIAFCNKLSLAEGLTPVYGVAGVNFATLTFGSIPMRSDPDWNAVSVNRSANGYRLPTEAEWMWAAMGADKDNPGAVNRTGYLKPFAGSTGSNSIGDYAVFGYRGTEAGRTAAERSNPVGSKRPNELGIYDLTGNVFEWCFDYYLIDDYYPQGSLAAGYSGPSLDYSSYPNDPQRCLRGGCWYWESGYDSVAYRGAFQSPWYYEGSTIGFRVVRN